MIEDQTTEETAVEAEATDRNLSLEAPETEAEGTDQDTTEEAAQNDPEAPEEEPETFPREYVEKLRDENARYRQRAQRSDELAHRLHRALVEADGRLADPTDLEFTEDHLEDSQALTEAIGELLNSKPHLASRRPRGGDIGMGAGTPQQSVDLAGILRAGAN